MLTLSDIAFLFHDIEPGSVWITDKEGKDWRLTHSEWRKLCEDGSLTL